MINRRDILKYIPALAILPVFPRLHKQVKTTEKVTTKEVKKEKQKTTTVEEKAVEKVVVQIKEVVKKVSPRKIHHCIIEREAKTRNVNIHLVEFDVRFKKNCRDGDCTTRLVERVHLKFEDKAINIEKVIKLLDKILPDIIR